MNKLNKNKHILRPIEQGMTLLEIMIVLTILALVMAFVIGPRILEQFGDAKIKLTKAKVNALANQSYLEWSLNSTGGACPKDINELKKYTNDKQVQDAWGKPFEMLCGDNAPDGQAIGISSSGPDMKKGTEDDIKSWEN